VDGIIACGPGTAQLAPGSGVTSTTSSGASRTFCGFVEDHAGRVKSLMASERGARGADARLLPVSVYGRVLRHVPPPVILHWLATFPNPQLAGYWGSSGHCPRRWILLAVVRNYRSKIDRE